MLKKQSAFTLMEVLTTLVILGVIAGLAMPAYFSTVEQGRSNEARVNLAIIRMGEKIYFTKQSPNAYWLPGANPPVNGVVGTAINQTLNVDITTQYYDITSINGTGGLQMVARRNTVAGGNGTTTCTMDVNGVITGC